MTPETQPFLARPSNDDEDVNVEEYHQEERQEDEDGDSYAEIEARVEGGVLAVGREKCLIGNDAEVEEKRERR